MSKKELKKKARAHAKAHGLSYQASRRTFAPETSSFVEQMAELAVGPSRVHSFVCCGFTQVFVCRIEPGFAEFEDVRCSHCGVVLANVRCDFGSPELVREVAGDANADLFAMTGSDGTRVLASSRSPKPRRRKPDRAK